MEGTFTRRQATLGSLAILTALTIVTPGLPWLDGQFSDTRSWQNGARYTIGCGVGIVPPPEVALDISFSRPGKTSATARFIADSGDPIYTVRVTRYRGSLADATGQFGRRLRAVRGILLRDDQTAMRTGEGADGRTGTFTTDYGTRSGRYVVLLSPAAFAVELLVIGNGKRLKADADAIDATFGSVTLTTGRRRAR